MWYRVLVYDVTFAVLRYFGRSNIYASYGTGGIWSLFDASSRLKDNHRYEVTTSEGYNYFRVRLRVWNQYGYLAFDQSRLVPASTTCLGVRKFIRGIILGTIIVTAGSRYYPRC